MKKLLLFPLLAILAMSATSPTTYNVDVNSSALVWTATKVTGQHTGTVKVKNGSLQLTDGKLTAGSFEVDMTTIHDTDMEGEYAGKLEGHLKSDDFFAVAKFPSAKFVITKCTPTATKGEYTVAGNLTIKDITNPVEFTALVSEASGIVTATGKMKINRAKFDVRYGSGSFYENLGDKTIYDDFDLAISLKAKK